jgi:peptide deformylase
MLRGPALPPMEKTPPEPGSETSPAPSSGPAPEFKVVRYPDPVLRRPAQPVTEFDPELRNTVEAMFRLMRTSEGVGLAGPQVGISRRILVINPTGEPGDDLALINPTLVDRSGPKTLFEEGCLSFPGIYAEVRRPERCTVESQDLDGNTIQATYEGFLSRVVQHEHDHLEGVLLVDRMSPADKVKNKAALTDLVDTYRRSRASGAPADADR